MYLIFWDFFYRKQPVKNEFFRKPPVESDNIQNHQFKTHFIKPIFTGVPVKKKSLFLFKIYFSRADMKNINSYQNKQKAQTNLSNLNVSS